MLKYLAEKYPNFAVIVIMPTKQYKNVYSIFDNFILNSNIYGAALGKKNTLLKSLSAFYLSHK